MAALWVAPPEPQEAARVAGLRYVSDALPGIRRKQAGRGFTYVGPDGDRISDRASLARIKSLAVPPAWTGVWVCPDPRGHIQANGPRRPGTQAVSLPRRGATGPRRDQ